MNTLDPINPTPQTAADLKHDALDLQEPTNSTDNKSDSATPQSEIEETPPVRSTHIPIIKKKQPSCLRHYFSCLAEFCTFIMRPFSTLRHHSRQKEFQAEIQKIKKDENYTILLPAQTHPRRVLVLDLDQTLIHTSVVRPSVYHFVSQVGINREKKVIYTTKRFGLESFLCEMAKLYELIVFTASPRVYADKMIDLIDPNGNISHRLYREHCIRYNRRIFLKNLRVLGRDMGEIVFVDDNSLAELLQPTTFYEIQPFYGKQDEHLLQLTVFLKHLHSLKQIGSVGEQRKKFQKMEMIRAIEQLEDRQRQKADKKSENSERREDRMKSTSSEGAALIGDEQLKSSGGVGEQEAKEV